MTYDHEGCHLDSALLPSHYHIRDMANQVLHLLEHLQIHEFHMIGHALGGIIGMELAKATTIQLNYHAQSDTN